MMFLRNGTRRKKARYRNFQGLTIDPGAGPKSCTGGFYCCQKAAANAAAELIRKKYGGYSGGADGSGYTLLDSGYGLPGYQTAPDYTAYESQYAGRIFARLSRVTPEPGWKKILPPDG